METLAGMMKTYGKSLEKATAKVKSGKNGKNKKNNNDNNGDKDADKDAMTMNNNDLTTPTMDASSAMEDYLVKIRNYFLTEARCENQLRRRILQKTTEVAELKSELAQYTSIEGLGLMMVTTTAQIQKQISENEISIQKDSKRIAALIEDGRSMYDELLARLECAEETYEKTMTTATAMIESTSSNNDNNENENDDDNVSVNDKNNNNNLATLFPTALLRDVPAAIKALQIIVPTSSSNNSNRLEKFVKEGDPAASKEEELSSSSSSSTGHDSSANANGDDDELVTTGTAGSAAATASSAQASSSSAAVAPKLAWASAAAGAGVSAAVTAATTPKKKQSLLDIQKEELESRNSIAAMDRSS